MFDLTGFEGFVTFFIGAVGLLVVGGVAVAVVKGIAQWQANEAAPLRSVDALVVSRRTDVRTTTHGGAPATQVGGPAQGLGGTMQVGAHRSTSTTYFVTFEEDSGERRELQVGGAEYGQLAEGDRGHLIHQGTRYKGFTRDA